jgi:hypothetical protein
VAEALRLKAAEKAAALEAAAWKEHRTAQGVPYYHNGVSGVTTWLRPAALGDELAAKPPPPVAAAVPVRGRRGNDDDDDDDQSTRGRKRRKQGEVRTACLARQAKARGGGVLLPLLLYSLVVTSEGSSCSQPMASNALALPCSVAGGVL